MERQIERLSLVNGTLMKHKMQSDYYRQTTILTKKLTFNIAILCPYSKITLEHSFSDKLRQ